MRFYHNVYVLLALTVGCSVDYSMQVSSQGGGQDMTTADAQRQSVTAFAQHALPLLQEMCANCHGNKQSPLFAVNDARQAHQVIIAGNKVNFNDIPNSRLVLRLTDDNHNCASNCATDGERVAAALNSWRGARADTEATTTGLVTASFNPSGAKRLRYDIGKLIDAKQHGDETIMLQVDIKPLSAGGGYVLSNIQVESRNVPVYIKGIKPLVNGVWNQLNSSLTAVACAAHPPASKLSNFSESTIIVDDATHQLAFAFEEVRIATAVEPNCQSETTVDDVTLQRKKNEFNYSMRGNFRAYCSCHVSYFEGDTAFNSVWLNKANIVNRMTVSNDRIMPPAIGAAALPEDRKTAMIKWLTDSK
ncbi:MAG: hypothetical protein OYH77_08895 [Pseudomonadota bacterium]|nr:hypothetical protein [Pseudomonadota bacterium]